MLAPLRVLFTGAPDNGKSTLIGALLTYCDNVLDDQRHEDLAYYTDGLDFEREQAMTLDVCYKTLVLKNGYRCILIDTPGHTELLDNFVCGATYSDLVISVVDSTRPDNTSPHLSWLADKLPDVPVISVATKSSSHNRKYDVCVDSYTGFGIDQLVNLLSAKAQTNYKEVS